MADETPKVEPVDPAVEAARVKYGHVVEVQAEGQTLAFRPFRRDELANLSEEIAKTPAASLALVTNAVKHTCVVGKAQYDELAARYPLMFAGDDSVSSVLRELARGDAKITVR